MLKMSEIHNMLIKKEYIDIALYDAL